MEPKELGRAIHHLRTQSRVGLRELSRLADISPASLLATEKGDSSPTLATLQKILRALGTDFGEFFAQATEKPDGPVCSSSQMRMAADEHREYVFLLPKHMNAKFEMVHETIAATETQSEWEVHDCDLAGVILSGGPGCLEIEGQGSWTLRKGDSFHIEAGARHRASNLGKRVLKQITVMYPARY